MVLNNECVRDLILWIEKNQTAKANGIIKPIKMKNIYSALSYSREDLNVAAQYLVDEKVLLLSQTQNPKALAPKWFVFCGITSVGCKYIAAIKDDTVWEKIRKALGSAAQVSVPAVLEIATKFL